MATEFDISSQQVLQWERDHVLHPWSVQSERRARHIVGAEGNYFWDSDGKRYLDFTAQFANANPGHGDPRIVDAIIAQARQLPFVATPFATEAKARAARLLAEVTPGDLSKTFFSAGGAQANEAAIKICRQVTGKFKVIGRYRSYHGAASASMSVSRDFRSWPNEPGVPGIVHALEAYPYRCPFGCEGGDECAERSAAHIEHVIRMEGGSAYVAGVMLEPIVGANGVIVPPDGYLQRVRDICDRYDALLIADEVMCGFGRAGAWFACDLWNVVPDILTLAKGLNGGYVPLGATVVRQHIADALDDRFLAHGHTYSGHALACAAAAATIEVYRADDLIERARELGAYLIERARALGDGHPCVGEVRGKGLFVGLEIVKNRKTREPFFDPLEPTEPSVKHQVLAEAMSQGVYMMPGVASVIMMTPPLTITREQIDLAMSVLDKALVIADQAMTD